MKKTLTALFLSLVLVLATFVAPTTFASAEEPSWFLVEDVEYFCGYIDPEVHFTVDVDGDVRIFIHTNDEDDGLVVVHPGDYKIVDTDIYVNKDSATKALVLTKYAKGYMTPADWDGLEFNFEELCSFVEQVFAYPTTVNPPVPVNEGELTLTVTLITGEPDGYVAYERMIDSNLWSKITTVDGEGNITVEYFFDGEVLVDIGKQFGSI